jgi:hypothetical protein
MAGPRLPRNERLQDAKGQVDQRFLRYWDQIKTRAYSAIQSFSEISSLDTIGETVDTVNDYLLIYNDSDAAAQKVAVGTIAAPTPPDDTSTNPYHVYLSPTVVLNCGTGLISGNSTVVETLNVPITRVLTSGAVFTEAVFTDRFTPKVSVSTASDEVTIYNTNSSTLGFSWFVVGVVE